MVGPFRVEDAWTPERLQAVGPQAWPVVAIVEALRGLPRLTIDERGLAGLRHGQQDSLRALVPGEPGEAALVLDGAGRVAAVIEMGLPATGWRLVRLLAE